MPKFGTQTTDESEEPVEIVEEGPDPNERIWSSHPLKTLLMGPYHFENATLKLSDPAKIEDFIRLLEQQPFVIKNGIKEISLARANAIAAGASRELTRGFDSAALRPERTADQTIGTKPVDTPKE